MADYFKGSCVRVGFREEFTVSSGQTFDASCSLQVLSQDATGSYDLQSFYMPSDRFNELKRFEGREIMFPVRVAVNRSRGSLGRYLEDDVEIEDLGSAVIAVKVTPKGVKQASQAG